MRAKPLMAIWTVLFTVSALTFNIESIIFWIAFIGFAATSTYIEKNQERLLKEMEDEE